MGSGRNGHLLYVNHEVCFQIKMQKDDNLLNESYVSCLEDMLCWRKLQLPVK